MAPHISVWLVARGVNLGLQTRIYFDDEAEANAACPVLNRIEHRERVQPFWRAARATGPTALTSACRGRTKPCSSTSDRT